MGDDQQRRLAANEALARDVNEVVEDVAATWFDPDEALEFRCECSNPDCEQHVRLTLAEYESVRTDALRFVVIDGHQNSLVEREIGRIREHVLVEKTGPGRDVARDTDPRA